MLGVTLAMFTVLNIRNGLGLANVDGIIQTGVVGALLIGSVLVPNLAQRIRLPVRVPEGGLRAAEP
jgi:rhamnose transport system permease protein